MTLTRGSSSSAPMTVHIAIIGDGITGLCMSLALSRRHVSHQVFPSTSPASHGPIWTLGPNAVHALNVIDPRLEDQFWEHSTVDLDPRRARWFSIRCGMADAAAESRSTVESCLQPLPLLTDVEAQGPFAQGRGCIHQDEFAQQIRALNGERKIGAQKVVKVNERADHVELRMEDHSVVTADLVLACDGVDGPAHRWLASCGAPSPKPTLSGYQYEMLIPWHDAQFYLGSEVANNGNIFVGRHAYITSNPVKHDHQSWLHVIAARQLSGQDLISSGRSHQGSREDFLHDFEGWAAPLRDLFHNVNTIPVRQEIVEYSVSLPRHRGRVCLLGEAAYPVALHESSLAGMILEDVALMSGLLPRRADQLWTTAATIFPIFETLRQGRAGRAMETARWAGRLLQYDHPDIGDDVAVVSLNAHHRWNWMWTYDIQWDFWRANDLMRQFKTRPGALVQDLTRAPDLTPSRLDEDEWDDDFEESSPIITSKIYRSEAPSPDSDLGFVDLGDHDAII